MGTTPEKVVTMYLDEKFKSATVEGELLAKCENLKTLSCASCGLTTLAGFPALANLKDLSLNDNRIADGLEALVGCKALSSLSLANNKLANVDDLKAVAEELTLSVLELEANPLTENEDYHEKVMTMMPTLNVLDGRDEFGNEIEDDDEDDDEDEDDEDDEDEDEDDDEDDEEADEDEDEDESEEEEEEEEEEMGLADLYGDKPLEDDDDDDDAFVEDEDPESEDIDEEESDDDEDEAAAKKPKI
jgi:Leucine-rich repeat (LRR) protein